MAGTKLALRDLARRWKALDDEIKQLSAQIEALVANAAPDLIQLHGVGTEIAGQFLATVGDNTGRIRNEAAFAKLCGVAPATGKQRTHHRAAPPLP
ncbi:transposase [Arthrobacter globiformis]|uniref:transposase n=1 Tax=Arthrobacter globiformis TaxID=1665 RepID=UPI0027945EF8|nr:transposase [Arthrobacter globiformis]MDQ0618565.1 transposase [Arthrobacter globiformis]